MSKNKVVNVADERKFTRIAVRATRDGQYQNAYRTKGEAFFVYDEKHFSSTWMERTKAAAVTEEKSNG